MIEIENLTRRFGSFVAVDHISFSVERGEVLGFLGPNGAGKSTTMKMITGFLAPSSGTIRVEGFDVQRDPIAVKQRIGYLPEGAPLWSDMSAGRFLEFIAGVRGLSGVQAVDRIKDVVEKTQIGSVLAQPIDTLSKGFKRRVGLAQALLHDPDVLILDEPTDGLDPNQKHEVRQLIDEMSEEKAIIISTHILEEVEAICTRAIIIAKGKIVVDATPEELLARSDQHNAVSLQISGDLDAARHLLQALPVVASVEVSHRNRLFVRSKGGAPILNDVGVAMRAHDITIDEIHLARGHLDHVFRSITTVQ
ncbi:MAG: ATP-binding cassette domain-containing protein [Alphaproteobacteria bacterium]|nr:ATP-binding cassette domain-containing protein [Alphaproteobacteria bacterium]